MSKGEEEKFGVGIHTFMGSDYKRLNELTDQKVAFLGIPLEYGASYRKGTAYASNAIRKYSAWDRVDGMYYFDLDGKNIFKSNDIKIADLGDLLLSDTNQSKDFKKIIDFISAIPKGVLPLIIGGDHSITYPCFKSIKQNNPNRKIALLHFDAHLDVEEDYLEMPEIWHGNFVRKLIEGNFIQGRDVLTVGPRGIIPKKWIDYTKDEQINIITASEFRENGRVNSIKKILNFLSDYDSVYITLDIDVLDIQFVPGTGTPQTNGLTPYDILEIMRSLRQTNVIALDLVEYSPSYDSNGQTNIIICEMLFNFLAFGLKV